MVSFRENLQEKMQFAFDEHGNLYRLSMLLTVISMFMISPSASGLSSGMPWHATLFTDVQTDFGNIEYRSGDGYAFDAIVSL